MTRCRRLLHVLLAGLWLAFAPTLNAEPPIFVPSDDLATGILQNMMAGKLLAKSNRNTAMPRQASAGGVTTLKSVGTPVVPQRLSARHPEAQRASIKRSLTQALMRYRRLEHQLGLPRNDVGGALATFVASHWAAYRDASVSADDYRSLVVQMRSLLVQDAAFQNATRIEQQAVYELLAITGMRIASAHEALKQSPDPEAQQRLRQAAGNALRQLLGADPDRLKLSADGLRLAAGNGQ